MLSVVFILLTIRMIVFIRFSVEMLYLIAYK